MSVTFLRPYKDGILLNVKVRPNLANLQPRLHTDAGGRTMLVLGVNAPPEKGKANLAVCALVADMLGVARSAVQVSRGATSPQKTLIITGVDASVADRKIRSLTQGA